MAIDEALLFRALDAAVAAFKETIGVPSRTTWEGNLPGRPPRIQRHLAKYPQDSWKFSVLTIIRDLIGEDEDAQFHSNDFSSPRREKELARRHPKHENVRSGVAVTLQGLIKDKVVERVARGTYRLH